MGISQPGASGTDTLIAKGTLGSAAASIDISGIPTGYRYIVCYLSIYIDSGTANQNALIRFNNDSDANKYETWYRFYYQGGAGDSGTTAATGIYLPCGNSNGASGATCVLTINNETGNYHAAEYQASYSDQTYYSGNVAVACYLSSDEISRITIIDAGGGNLDDGCQYEIVGIK